MWPRLPSSVVMKSAMKRNAFVLSSYEDYQRIRKDLEWDTGKLI